MKPAERERFKGQERNTPLDRDSEEDSSLNWLGDLLDPWKGTNVPNQRHLNQLYETRSSDKSKDFQMAYHLVSHPQNKALASYDNEYLDNPMQTLNISDHQHIVIISDEESSLFSHPVQTRMSLFDRKMASSEQNLNQIVTARQTFEKANDDLQKEPQISFSMLFNHSLSNARHYQSPNLHQPNPKKQNKLDMLGHYDKENQDLGAQFFTQNKKESNEQNQDQPISSFDYSPSRRKKIQRKLKILSKKRTISPFDKLQFIENYTPLQNIQKSEEHQKQQGRLDNLTKISAHYAVQVLNEDVIQEADQNDEVPVHPNAENNQQQNQQSQAQSSIRSSFRQETESNPEVEQEINEMAFANSRRIRSSLPEKILTPRELEIVQEFQHILRIVNDRQILNDKEYRWEIGTERHWKSLANALNTNFNLFIRHSNRYKSKIIKYLPKRCLLKKQGQHKFEGKLNGQNPNYLIKIERRHENKIKRKNRELATLKEIFDRVQLSKVMEYEKLIEEKGRNDVLDEFEDALFTEYEPESPLLEEMLQEIVINANASIRNKKIKRNQVISQQEEKKAMDELLIYKLNQASEGFNYIEGMRKLFDFNKKKPTLSCLEPNGLGLRSTTLKIIDKDTFEAEMRRVKLMNTPIVLNDFETTSNKQMSLKSEPERKLIQAQLQ